MTIKTFESELREIIIGYTNEGKDEDVICSAIKLLISKYAPKDKQGLKFHSGRQHSELSPYSPKDNQKVGYNSYRAKLFREMGITQ